MPGYSLVILYRWSQRLHMSDTQCPLCLFLKKKKHLYNDFMIQIIASSWHYNEESILCLCLKIINIIKICSSCLKNDSKWYLATWDVLTNNRLSHTHTIRTTAYLQIKPRHFSFWSHERHQQDCIFSIISDQRGSVIEKNTGEGRIMPGMCLADEMTDNLQLKNMTISLTVTVVWLREGRGPGERIWCLVQVKGPSEGTAAEGRNRQTYIQRSQWGIFNVTNS